VEEWKYRGVVDRKSRPANLRDIADYGKIEDILGIISHMAFLPLKFCRKKLTEKQVNAVLSNVIWLFLFSGILAATSKPQGLNPYEKLTRCYRESLRSVAQKLGIEELKAIGVPQEKIKAEQFVTEYLTHIKVRDVARASKIDDKFRITLPRFIANALGWKVGENVLALPYHTKKFGLGLFLTLEKAREKKHEKYVQGKQHLEFAISLLENFVSEIGKRVSREDVEKCIDEDVELLNLLPREILQYGKGLLR